MSTLRSRRSARQALPRFHNLTGPSWTKADIPPGFEWFGEKIGILHAGMLGEQFPRDLSGNGAHAVAPTLGASATHPSLTSGTAGRPLSFDGTHDYYTIADNEALNFPATSDGGWTLAFLIENSTTTANFDYIFSWGNYQATPSFNFHTHGTNSRLNLECFTSGGNHRPYANDILPLTELSLVCIVAREEAFPYNDIRIWINGVDVTTGFLGSPGGNMSELNVSGSFYHMRRNSAANQNPDGDIYWWGRWDFPWSAGQMRQLAETPVAPFQTHRPVLLGPSAAPSGFIPYPNPRYVLTGGMQTMSGGT